MRNIEMKNTFTLTIVFALLLSLTFGCKNGLLLEIRRAEIEMRG